MRLESRQERQEGSQHSDLKARLAIIVASAKLGMNARQALQEEWKSWNMELECTRFRCPKNCKGQH